jgi:hypothetical protein
VGEGRASIVEVTGRREQYSRIFIRQPTHTQLLFSVSYQFTAFLFRLHEQLF